MDFPVPALPHIAKDLRRQFCKKGYIHSISTAYNSLSESPLLLVRLHSPHHHPLTYTPPAKVASHTTPCMPRPRWLRSGSSGRACGFGHADDGNELGSQTADAAEWPA